MTNASHLFLAIIVLALLSCSGKSNTMLVDINQKKETLTLLDEYYMKYQNAVTYLTNVVQTNDLQLLNRDDCVTYYNYSKNNFVDLNEEINDENISLLSDLENAVDSLINYINIVESQCGEKGLGNDQSKLLAYEINRAINSEEEFLKLASTLIGEYKQDVNSYNAQVYKETQKKLKWSRALKAFSDSVNQSNTQKPSGTLTTNNDDQSNFMCKRALSNRDPGGIDTFCSDMNFMLRDAIKQGNKTGIDTFGDGLDLLCREAIKNGDGEQIMIFCN